MTGVRMYIYQRLLPGGRKNWGSKSGGRPSAGRPDRMLASQSFCGDALKACRYFPQIPVRWACYVKSEAHTPPRLYRKQGNHKVSRVSAEFFIRRHFPSSRPIGSAIDASAKQESGSLDHR